MYYNPYDEIRKRNKCKYVVLITLTCLGLCRAWLANSAQGLAFEGIDDLESCLGKTTFIGGTDGTWPDFFKSSNFPGFLGAALLGLSTLDSVVSWILLLLGVIVTVPGLS